MASKRHTASHLAPSWISPITLRKIGFSTDAPYLSNRVLFKSLFWWHDNYTASLEIIAVHIRRKTRKGSRGRKVFHFVHALVLERQHFTALFLYKSVCTHVCFHRDFCSTGVSDIVQRPLKQVKLESWRQRLHIHHQDLNLALWKLERREWLLKTIRTKNKVSSGWEERVRLYDSYTPKDL